MPEEAIKPELTRLFRCVIVTNVGDLPIFVKTRDAALNKAKESAKKQAEGIFVSNLVGDGKFSYAYLDKVELVFEEEAQ